MTGLLIRIFLGSGFNPKNPSERARAGLMASIVCIACNIALCTAKAAVGIAAGSVSIVADAVNNLSDASSNVLSLVGFKLAAKPADADHPYGHGRYEYLAGLGVALIVCALGVDLIKESMGKLAHPETSEIALPMFAVLIVSMLVKLWMLAFNRSLGQRIESETLLAAAQDSKNDVFTTGAVLACALIESQTGITIDGWAGLAVGVFITVSGIKLLLDTTSPLLGRAPSPEYVESIRKRILSYPGILGTHDLMVHDYGPSRGFVSAHVEMNGNADAFANHEIIDTIERDFKREHGLELTLHYDPIDISDTAEDPRVWLAERLSQLYPGISVHDLRIEESFVTFDLVKPDNCTLSDEALVDAAIDLAHERWPETPCSVVLDHGYLKRT